MNKPINNKFKENNEVMSSSGLQPELVVNKKIKV